MVACGDRKDFLPFLRMGHFLRKCPMRKNGKKEAGRGIASACKGLVAPQFEKPAKAGRTILASYSHRAQISNGPPEYSPWHYRESLLLVESPSMYSGKVSERRPRRDCHQSRLDYKHWDSVRIHKLLHGGLPVHMTQKPVQSLLPPRILLLSGLVLVRVLQWALA